jgi:hypothetical protein
MFPAQFAKQQDSRTACIDQVSGVEVSAQDAPPNHREHLSAEKTTVALVALFDRPVAAWAATALWDENREAIEREMARSLHPSSDVGLRERVLSGLVSQARFFCLEVDEPKAWVARCANLESRRVALTLKK